MNKLITGLIKQLEVLTDESEEIFFAERPFLEIPTDQPKIISLDERREQNEEEIKQTKEALDYAITRSMGEAVPVKAPIAIQTPIFRME